MDDDDLRRGRATVHREFGEAEAVLAGDALLTLGLEILGAMPPGDEYVALRADAVVTVARAAGVAGMVGGQIADLEAERQVADPDRLEWIHRHKTAALLAASAELGAILARAPAEARAALRRYGIALGLAFQIADDILDLTSTPERLGKTPGKDLQAGKSTYPSLYGIEGSRREANRLIDLALTELGILGPPDPILAELARFAASRSR
jgi:geranylgeranyl pyrophosphate synthase